MPDPMMILSTSRQQQAALADDEFLAWINARVVTASSRVVAIEAVNNYLIRSGLLLKLLAAMKSDNADVANVATLANEYLKRQSTLNFDDPLAGQLLPGLVATKVFTQEEIDSAVDALTNTYGPRWGTLGLTAEVTPDDLKALPAFAAAAAVAAKLAAMVWETDRWINFMGLDAITTAAMMGATAEQVAAWRTGMIDGVQQWKGVVAAGGDVSQMPATAVELLAAVKLGTEGGG